MENGEGVQESANDSLSPVAKLDRIAADNNNRNDNTSNSVVADLPNLPVDVKPENHVSDDQHLGSNGHEPPIPTSDLPDDEPKSTHDQNNEHIHAEEPEVGAEANEGKKLAESVWQEVTGDTQGVTSDTQEVSGNTQEVTGGTHPVPAPDVQVTTEESFSQEGPEAVAVKTEKIVTKTTLSNGGEQTEEIVREMKNVESAVTNVEDGLPTETKQATDSFKEVVTTEVRPAEADGTVVRTTNTVTVERVQGSRTTTINLDDYTPEQLEQLLRDRGAEGLLKEPPGTEIVHEEGSRAYDVHEGTDIIVHPEQSAVVERAAYPTESEETLDDKINQPVAEEELLSAIVTTDTQAEPSITDMSSPETNKEDQAGTETGKADKGKSPKTKHRGLFSLFRRRSSIEEAKKKEEREEEKRLSKEREEEKRASTLEKKNKKKKEKEDKQKEKAAAKAAEKVAAGNDKSPTVVITGTSGADTEHYRERGVDVPANADDSWRSPDSVIVMTADSPDHSALPAGMDSEECKTPEPLVITVTSSNEERTPSQSSGLSSPKDSVVLSNSRPHSIALDDNKHSVVASTPVKGGTSPMSNETIEGALAANTSSFIENCWPIDDASPVGHFVVVAIDFGTTFSGYAFSFVRDPDSIHMMRKWEGGDPGVINQKTPTTLLLSPDGKFHSFGFHARDFFHDLDAQESKKWHYFEKFKMMLHYNSELNSDTMVVASSGQSFSALTIFAHALRFFHDHSLQELSDQSATRILNQDVRWVITVPAIWKAPAKQFMRQAAYDAGIASAEYPDQLLIALEPEAASIYVRRLRMHLLVPEKPVSAPLTLPRDSSMHEPMNTDKVAEEIVEGTRYMVVDCGGGTVDITVHEMTSQKGHLLELYKAAGGPFGSVGVDVEFEKLLIALFGADFIEAFKAKRPAGWVDLMMAFESRKRAASPFKPNPLNVSLPFSFIDYYKKFKGSQVESAIRKFGDKEVRWSSQGMLRLTPEAMGRLFQPTLEKIKQSIGDVLNQPSVRDIKYIFLVGGFAESAILQQEIRKEFGHIIKLLIPQECSLAVLKGAVCFGLDPTVVQLRVSRMTYGIGVLNRFIHGKHPKSKMVKKDGGEWCTDIFDKFVKTDQSLALGDSVLRSYTPVRAGQNTSIINVYCSEKSDTAYITDSSVTKCGTLRLELPPPQPNQPQPKRREIQARMIFGDTEIKVTALDVASGKYCRANIDFLNK